MDFKITVTKADPQHKNMDLLVYPVVLDKKSVRTFTEWFRQGFGQDPGPMVTLNALQKNKAGIVLTPMPARGPKRVLVIGVERSKSDDLQTLMGVYAGAAKFAAANGVTRAGLMVIGKARPQADVRAAVMGFLLASYGFDTFKSKKDPSRKLRVELYARGMKVRNTELEAWTRVLQATVKAVFMARDMVQTPPSMMDTDAMVRKAEELVWPGSMSIKVMRKKELLDMGANLLLAVGSGGSHQPALVHMSYTPPNPKASVALVGKGITYDAGGYHLKPRGYLEDMKGDMAGAAAVYGAIRAAAELELPVEVHGIAAITDNLISDKSMLPGDVFTAMNGKTVEVWDTDAEGRLVLADALTYADRLKPDYMVDLATLTGACLVALGEDAAGLFTEDNGLARLMEQASEATGELIWRLPFYESIREKLNSDIADIKNIGGRWGGAIQGAMFLREFVNTKKWAHLDIAGPALRDNASAISPKGGSGFGVALLVDFLARLGEG